MSWSVRIAFACAAFACLDVFAAEALYMASIRSPIGGDPNVAGNLYLVNPENGAAKLLFPIRVDGKDPVGVTGLAFHPINGTLYGVTALLSPTHPHSLVRINMTTGNATLIGDLGAAGSDISFAKDGTLFVWMRESRQIGTINLSTGVATPRGPIGPPETVGGLTLDSRGVAYVAATGATGSLDTVDTKTGLITKGIDLKGAPLPNGINSLTTSRKDEIYAVNTNMGNPATTLLVKIDPKTGVVTKVGPLPNDSDAITFAPAEDGGWGVIPWVLAVLGLVAGLFLVLRGLRRTRPGPPASA